VKLLGAGAGTERRRAGSSRRGELHGRRALVLAATTCKLVVTTDPLVVKTLLRDEGDSSESLFRWTLGVARACGWCLWA
jgi:hypothetical protein